MSFDYLANFPIPDQLLPPKLRSLLMPVGLSAEQRVEVAAMLQVDPHGNETEELHLLMAAIPLHDDAPVGILREADHGVVQYSVPFEDGRGCWANFSPSISGHDYIVASWGDGSFYTFHLGEKVWMTLGLTPRCVGNEQQRLVYDDLGLPEFGVAEGEVSSDFFWSLKRTVSWSMSNEYLRRYLWLRGASGVRVFYYSAKLPDAPEIRRLLGNQSHMVYKPTDGVEWYELDLREHDEGILLQVRASVLAVTPELCQQKTAEGLLWPGDDQPMTRARADSLTQNGVVYLDDRFLQKYEESAFYESTPVYAWGHWYCSPSYRGQWRFTECRRVGRNLLQVPIRELYKPKPEREILHAWAFAVTPEKLAHLDRDEEHVAAKVQRLVQVLMRLGSGLSILGSTVGLSKSAVELVRFEPAEIESNGWLSYPELGRLAQVAPLDMSQQSFLARCKSLHELWQHVPNGFLKSLLKCAGCPNQEIKKLGSLKLLQALLNIVKSLNEQEETQDAFSSSEEPEAWNGRNDAMAALFLTNDLRIADAHEAMGASLATLQQLGFDIAGVNEGYGRALDFVMDAVIDSLATVATEIEKLVKRG